MPWHNWEDSMVAVMLVYVLLSPLVLDSAFVVRDGDSASWIALCFGEVYCLALWLCGLSSSRRFVFTNVEQGRQEK